MPTTTSRRLRSANRGVRFLVEIAAIVALGVGGAHLPAGPVVRFLAANLLPIVAMVLWGRYVAPRAKRFGTLPIRLAVEVVVLGGGAVALAASGFELLAAVLGGVVVANLVVVHATGDDLAVREDATRPRPDRLG